MPGCMTAREPDASVEFVEIAQVEVVV
jgi:hypothetical protein